MHTHQSLSSPLVCYTPIVSISQTRKLRSERRRALPLFAVSRWLTGTSSLSLSATVMLFPLVLTPHLCQRPLEPRDHGLPHCSLWNEARGPA